MGKIQLKPEQLIEWDGFDVYDVETEVDLLPSEVANEEFPEDKGLSMLVNGFALSWDGELYLTREDGGIVYVPQNGKYLIRINGEKYMRW